jgi:Tol biopolymer transport system component
MLDEEMACRGLATWLTVAFVGTGDEGSPQIFIAGIDGTGVSQLTHDPTGAMSPAWSPVGTRISYVASESEFRGGNALRARSHHGGVHANR